MRRYAAFPAVLLAFVSFSAGAVGAQTVDEVVARNLKAKGGLEKLKSVNTVKMTGTMTTQGNDLLLTVWSKRPNLFRREAELQGQKVVQASDGATVWMVDPRTGSATPQQVPEEQAKLMKSAAEFDGVFVDYKSRGIVIELVGNEKLEGKDVYHLKVTPKGGDMQDYYLDATTGLEIKVTRPIAQGGMKMSIETELSNYKEVDGMMVPFTTRQSLNGSPAAQVTVQKVEFNVPIDDALFKMPAAAR
jgi:outer membrane lipoprotein-sorting protein